MKTYATRESDIERTWRVIDADGEVLGRLSSQVAHLLMGKHKPIYSPHLDTGDYVIVVNAARVRVTGRKAQQKVYYRHSGYPGGLKRTTYAEMMKAHPERVIEHSVKGMLPHNRLGARMFRKLRVYEGGLHPHRAQVKEKALE